MMTRSENITLGERVGIPLPVVLRLRLLLIGLLIRLRMRLVVPMHLCCMLLRWLLLRWLLLLPCLGCLISSKILRFLLVLRIGLRVIGLRVCFAAFSAMSLKVRLLFCPPPPIPR